MSISRLPTYTLAQARRIINYISHVQGATLSVRSSKHAEEPSKLVTDLPDPRAVVDAFEDVKRNAVSGSGVVLRAASMEFTLRPLDFQQPASVAPLESSTTQFELSVTNTANDAPTEGRDAEEEGEEYVSFRIFDDYGAGSFVWGQPSLPEEPSVPLYDDEDYSALISPSLAQAFTEWMRVYETTWDVRRRIELPDGSVTEDWSVHPFESDREVTAWVVRGAILAMRMAGVVKRDVEYSAYLKQGVVFRGEGDKDAGVLAGLLLDLEARVSGWPSKTPK